MKSDDEKIQAKSSYLEKLRLDKIRQQSETLKQAESIKQNFINEGDIIMDNLRKKGEYIEQLYLESKERHHVLKDVHRRLKKLNLAKFVK